MELKVVCGCGQKYKFDVEPVNGQMPFAVNCPSCGVDGTPVANQLLAEHFINNPPAPAPPPPSPAPGGLRINRPAPPPTPAPSPADDATPPPIAPLPSPVGAPLRAYQARAAALDPNTPAKKPNFWMGIVGAALGALLGAAVSFLIVKFAGIGWRLIVVWAGSLVTGYLAGAGAQFLGKGEGSKELGGITAIFAIAGIVATQYFIALSWWHNTVIATIDSAYGQSVQDAREAVAAMPTGSDSEIRKYLVKQGVDEGDDVTTNSITDDAVKDFRQNQLPELQELASGRMTKEEYDAKHGIDPAQEKKDMEAESETFKSIFLLLFIRKITIISICAGAALAYRITANA
jgi:hypothetical protein